jgi:ArsR family transcriptional regulator
MDAAETARVFAALGHEGRLSIFRLLAAAGPDGLPAGEVARRTAQLQNTASSNLGVLANAGLVSARRDGRSIIYALTHTRFSGALEFLAENFLGGQPAARAAFFQPLLDACAAPAPVRDADSDRGHNAA